MEAAGVGNSEWSDLRETSRASLVAGDLGSIPRLGRSPEDGKGYPLQDSGLDNTMDCLVHGVTKSQTQLSDFHFTHFYQRYVSSLKHISALPTHLIVFPSFYP